LEQDALAVRSRVEFEFREVVFPASGYILFGVRVMVVGYHAHAALAFAHPNLCLPMPS